MYGRTLADAMGCQLLTSLLIQSSPSPPDSYSISASGLTLVLLAVFVGILLLMQFRRNDIWSFRLTVLSLLGIGIVVLFVHIPHVDQAFTHSFADAIIIASILAFTVDVYVKERVLREVSTDVSKYLIGYRLPEEVQDRIRSLLQTRWIRRNCSVRMRLTEIPNKPGYVKIVVVMSKDVENITTEEANYQDSYRYEKHQPENITEVRCDSPDPNAQYRIVGEELAKEVTSEPGVMEALGKSIKIPPVHEAIGKYYRMSIRTEAEYPDNYSDILTFDVPTLSVVFEAECPLGFRVSLTPADVTTPNRWEYRRLFLGGEHIRFRWEKQREGLD